MEISPAELKKLGFRPKKKSFNEWEIDVEVAPRNYISISITLDRGNVLLSGLEIEGAESDRVRKTMFSTFDFEEIKAFLEQY